MHTHAEHVKKAIAFRQDLLDPKIPFPDRDGEWLQVLTRVTCETPGCQYSAVVQLYENADGLYRAHCGVCDKQILNIVGIFSDGEYPLATAHAS